MSHANVRAFFEKIEADEDLSDRYKSLLKGLAGGEVDEDAAVTKVVQFASESGYEFAPEDLRSVAEEMKGEALSDEELDAVAGGAQWLLIVTTADEHGPGGVCVIVGW